MPFIKVNGKSLFYTIDGGDGSGPVKSTTLFIHGLGSSSCFYKTVIPALSATTRCIALDTPGSGLSDLSSDQSIETITEDATGLLYALNIQENVIVVGHSMGGIVATHLAAQNPSLVTGVVLLGPVNPSPALAEPFEKRIEVVKSSTHEPFPDS
jgi:pimeloyl-ACP methyl ester carboxylesterase